jgi:cadmium resistance protein CadD (predicted permease)
LALGIRAAWESWREQGDPDGVDEVTRAPVSVVDVTAVTFANGGDNIGVYVPVLATAGIAGMTVYVIVFQLLVAVWVAAGRFVATRPVVARALSRWGHILLPVVLIGIGLLILAEGGAFGL